MAGRGLKATLKYLLCCSFIFLLTTYICLQYTTTQNYGSVTKTNENDFHVKLSQDRVLLKHESELPTLKEHKNEIPICIVDEHNEVIPYWYKAVDEGIIKATGNTLIHIDGHSDMAGPVAYEPIREFKHIKNAHDSSFLPLMQSNDVFIISAIMKGLISQVVWVIPSWNDYSINIALYKSYVGVTKNKFTGQDTVCGCHKEIKSKKNIDCIYTNREAVKEEDIQITIKSDECKKLKPFTFITVSEDKFINLVNLKKVKNLFVDIDEDYFGVESGVKQFVIKGIRLETQEQINEILFSLYCPESVEEEQVLDFKLRDLFKHFSTLESKSSREIKIGEKINSATSNHYCQKNEKYLQGIFQTAVKLFSSLKNEELSALSEVKYCLANSPRLFVEEPRFQLCHGTINPGDTLNQIYVGDEEEIRTRGKQLTNMISFIYNHTQPRFFTIARSLRDGYTPRSQQRLIETVLLESLGVALSKQGKQKKVIYDKELVFGKNGWTT